MSTESLFGINSGSQSTPEELFSRYQIDPTEEKELTPSANETLIDYSQEKAFESETTGQHEHDGINSKPLQIRVIKGLLINMPLPPTYTPQTVFEQIRIVDSLDNDRVYIFDPQEQIWKFFLLNTIAFSETQLTLPIDATFSLGWSNPGGGSTAIPFANGSDLSSSGTAYGFTNSLLGDPGILDFTNQKTIKFELDLNQKFNSVGIKNAFGFSDTGSVAPAHLVNKAVTTVCIKFVIEQDDLYAVVADGAANTTVHITPLVFGTLMRKLKFIWTPTKNVQFFVGGILAATITTNLPTANGLFLFLAGVGTSAGVNGMQVIFPRYSVGI